MINPHTNDRFMEELDLAIRKLNLLTGVRNLYRLGENARGQITFTTGLNYGYYWNEEGQWICKGTMLFTWNNRTTKVNDIWIHPLPLVSLLEHLRVIKDCLKSMEHNDATST